MKLLSTLLIGLLGGLIGALLLSNFSSRSEEERIADFYATENAVHMSPHSIRKGIMKHDDSFVLVDLRSEEEYEREHIIGAVNIPAYKDPDTSAYDEVDRIVKSFKALDSSKNIIVYCYSMPCMTGRKIGNMLTEHGIYVKHLGIGWNEWRHFWNLWNHEHEWKNTDVKEYVATGKDPGVFKGIKKHQACPIKGDFGC